MFALNTVISWILILAVAVHTLPVKININFYKSKNNELTNSNERNSRECGAKGHHEFTGQQDYTDSKNSTNEKHNKGSDKVKLNKSIPSSDNIVIEVNIPLNENNNFADEFSAEEGEQRQQGKPSKEYQPKGQHSGEKQSEKTHNNGSSEIKLHESELSRENVVTEAEENVSSDEHIKFADKYPEKEEKQRPDESSEEHQPKEGQLREQQLKEIYVPRPSIFQLYESKLSHLNIATEFDGSGALDERNIFADKYSAEEEERRQQDELPIEW